MTANSVAGGPYVVTAAAVEADGQTVTFNLTNTSYVLTIAGGDNQTADPGRAFAAPLQLTVVDDAGKPASGAVITFSVPGYGAGASLSTYTPTADGSGALSVAAMANFVAGGYTVTAEGRRGERNLHLVNSNASFWTPDPLDPGKPQPAPDTPPATAVPGWWWRDTTNQNAIAQHSADEFTGQVYQVFSSSKLKVMVYSSLGGPNVTVALVGLTVGISSMPEAEGMRRMRRRWPSRLSIPNCQPRP